MAVGAVRGLTAGARGFRGRRRPGGRVHRAHPYADRVKSLPASVSAVAATISRILASRGPLSRFELARALEGSGLTLGDDAENLVAEVEDAGAMPQVVTLHDGRYAYLPSLFAGRAFTHRVTELEATHDLLAAAPDLSVVTMACDDEERFARLTDGGEVTVVLPSLDAAPLLARGIDPDSLADDEYALLPAGTLAKSGVGPGDLVGITLTEEGLSLARVDGPVSDPARLRATVRGWLRPAGREPYPLPPLVWRLCATTDAFAAAELPLSELLAAWDLSARGDMAARDGFDFDGWHLEEAARRVARTHGIDEDVAFAVVVLAEQYRSLEELVGAVSGLDDDKLDEALSDIPDGPSGVGTDAGGTSGLLGSLGELAGCLADPGAAEALLAETLGAGTRAAALGLLAESLRTVAPDAAQPAVLWLLAKAHERRGDVAGAEAGLRDAVAAGAAGLRPFTPALRDLARFASDRGRAREALDLLRLGGVGRDDPEVALLTHMSSMAARDLGRNQPCWCGSGRKYKVCHLGKEELPLAERAAWLYQKAGAYAQEGPWRGDILDVAVERAAFSRSEVGLVEALSDGLVIDAVLFEGGAFADFLAVRGSLLPDDERLLAEQWLLCPRSVHEVTSVRPGTSVTLRDVRTGDVHVVRERTASRVLSVGTFLCSRVVPAGDTWQIFGGAEPVALHERESLMALLDADPHPVELVEFLSRRFATPTMTNTEGEPFELHEVTLRSSDPAAVATRLDAAYGPPDADGAVLTWHERVPGRQEVRAFVHLEGNTVTVSTNSRVRVDRVLAALRAADPGAEILSHESRTGAELTELAERFPGLRGGAGGAAAAPDLTDGAVADAVAGLMRRYEDSWLDESIPALAGLTPRQAADDPTRRDDVVRLLRSFPAPAPQSMDRDRLAAALGLDIGDGGGQG